MNGRSFVISQDAPERRAPIARTQHDAGIDWYTWEGRVQPPRPLWKDFAAGIIGGLIVLPPLCLYVAPFIVAFAKAYLEQ